MTKSDFPPVLEEPASAVRYDEAFVFDVFNAPNSEEAIDARERGRYKAEHAEAGVARLEIEAADEHLAHLRCQLKRARDEQTRADLTIEKQAAERQVRLTLHDRLTYWLMLSLSLIGILVANYVLATYAADSGVIKALDGNLFAALLMAFPVAAASQAVKAVGALFKDDSAKRRYYLSLAMVAAAAFCVFVFGMVVTFAPSPVDVAAFQESLNTGAPLPKAGGFVTACKDIAPYLTVGGGLVLEILAAAVVSNRADAINALGRDTYQGINPTLHLLDEHIVGLQRQIEECAKKTGRLRAEVERHDAILAGRIAAAQAHAEALATEYAGFAAQSLAQFRSQRSK